jgi:flagellar P-ring protein precursor FlgI
LRRARRRAAPTARRTPSEWAAVGRALAQRDERELVTRREQDATRRRIALATGTVIADRRHRLTPYEAMVAVPRLVERTVGFVVAELADTVRPGSRRSSSGGVDSLFPVVLVALLVGALPNAAANAQDIKIRDLTIAEGAAPIRLVGYGLAVGLDGSGDRGTGARGSGMTVTSVVNLLRRFDVEVPAEMMRTRNVAAVLVTAEVSPYLRSGGRFDVHVSSLGDARSLRGGVLWMTPLVAEAGGKPMAAAQGALMLSEAADPRDRYAAPTVETSARLPNGGQLEADLPRPSFAGASRLLLKEPDVGTASKIAASINAALGSKVATVEDPGAIALALPDSGDRALILSRVRDLAVRPDRTARLIIDGRDGTVVAGGDITVGEAVVSHGAVTLSIGAASATPGDTSNIPGDVRVAPGTSVQKVAAALHAMQTPAPEIAAIFLALREVGALSAEVIVR